MKNNSWFLIFSIPVYIHYYFVLILGIVLNLRAQLFFLVSQLKMLLNCSWWLSTLAWSDFLSPSTIRAVVFLFSFHPHSNCSLVRIRHSHSELSQDCQELMGYSWLRQLGALPLCSSSLFNALPCRFQPFNLPWMLIFPFSDH